MQGLVCDRIVTHGRLKCSAASGSLFSMIVTMTMHVCAAAST